MCVCVCLCMCAYEGYKQMIKYLPQSFSTLLLFETKTLTELTSLTSFHTQQAPGILFSLSSQRYPLFTWVLVQKLKHQAYESNTLESEPSPYPSLVSLTAVYITVISNMTQKTLSIYLLMMKLLIKLTQCIINRYYMGFPGLP